jgi:hypothetical protein
VDVQFAPVRLDELSKRLAVSVPRAGEQQLRTRLTGHDRILASLLL